MRLWSDLLSGQSFRDWLGTRLSGEKVQQGVKLDPFVTSMRNAKHISGWLNLIAEGEQLEDRGGAGKQNITDLRSAGLMDRTNISLSELGVNVLASWDKYNICNDSSDDEFKRFLVLIGEALAVKGGLYTKAFEFWKEIRRVVDYKDAVTNPESLYLLSFLNKDEDGFNPWNLIRDLGLEFKESGNVEKLNSSILSASEVEENNIKKLKTWLGGLSSRAKARQQFCIAMELLLREDSEIGSIVTDPDITILIGENNLGAIRDIARTYSAQGASISVRDKAKNLILYGPPGTGKTYHTVNRALEILEPELYEINKTNRTALKEQFDRLKGQNLIGFVTFHQSFSYEDFVEGLRAEASEDGSGINYYVQDGIFKILCDQAKKDLSKGSIDEAIIKLIDKLEDEPLKLQTSTGKSFSVTYRGGRTFRIKPDSSEKDVDYPASIENIKRIYRGGKLKEIYNASYVLGILNHLKDEFELSDESEARLSAQPVVLIIDEINRGNTANIFGELITLIEPSKRAGKEEALSVTLPYSQENFSVPDNLYIIGTMNTADRSLSHIDTALRRRFVFEEMMPETQLLNGINVDGVNIQNMLSVINDRIEVLYDREHTLGHSFFLPLRSNPKIEELARIFELQIIPLLEEYFFEDWEKIRMVLGDNKKLKENAFITKKYNDSKLVELLGSDHHLHSQSSVYERNSKALSNPESYIGIYQTRFDSDEE